MRAGSRDQGREISKDELLKIAPFSKGQLTKIYRAGYLPRPHRRSRPGSKKPVYVWDESVIEQAKFLHDVLQWDRFYRWAGLSLWLRGYAVEFAPIRQQWLDSIDANLQGLTQGNGEDDDPADEPEDHISRLIGQMTDRLKHTPTLYRPEPLRQFGMEGIETYARWAESFFDGLLVADYELDETPFAAALGEDVLWWLQTLQEILALPRLREVIEQAPPEAWEQARLDYMTLCQFLRTFAGSPEQEDPEGMFPWLFTLGAYLLVPVALAIRQRGYGQWLDDGFAWVSKRLVNPETQAMLAWAADPEIRARLSDLEGRAWLAGQLARRHAEAPG